MEKMKYEISVLAVLVSCIFGESIRGEIKSQGDTSDKFHHINALYNELEEKCLPKDMHFDRLIERTQLILNNMKRYKDLVNIKHKLREEIEYLITETKGSKQVHDLVHLLKSDIKDTCLFVVLRGCEDITGQTSGVFDLVLDKETPYKAHCNMKVDGGRWTVIQRRQSGVTNFQKTWEEYKKGFGDLNGDFWLGNNLIHRLTSSGRYELRVDISDWNGNSWYALYKTFKIGPESDKYKLTVGGYSGTAGDSLEFHNGMFFSTKDQDNDNDSGGQCSQSYGEGGWWYKDCHKSNLNGLRQKGKSSNEMSWYHAEKKWEGMKTSRLMIRQY